MKILAIALGTLFCFSAAHAQGVREDFIGYLKLNAPVPVTVACASADCRKVAKTLVYDFKYAGWPVKYMGHGGFGIDGVEDIRVDGCGDSARSLGHALQQATGTPVTEVNDGACQGGLVSLFIVVGEPKDPDEN